MRSVIRLQLGHISNRFIAIQKPIILAIAYIFSLPCFQHTTRTDTHSVSHFSASPFPSHHTAKNLRRKKKNVPISELEPILRRILLALDPAAIAVIEARAGVEIVVVIWREWPADEWSGGGNGEARESASEVRRNCYSCDSSRFASLRCCSLVLLQFR